jgi:hypothetical protein
VYVYAPGAGSEWDVPEADRESLVAFFLRHLCCNAPTFSSSR